MSYLTPTQAPHLPYYVPCTLLGCVNLSVFRPFHFHSFFFYLRTKNKTTYSLTSHILLKYFPPLPPSFFLSFFPSPSCFPSPSTSRKHSKIASIYALYLATNCVVTSASIPFLYYSASASAIALLILLLLLLLPPRFALSFFYSVQLQLYLSQSLHFTLNIDITHHNH